MSEIIKLSDYKQSAHQRAVDESDVCKALRVSPSKLARMIKAGDFKKPMKFGYRMKRWLESDIDEYLKKMSAAR